MKKLLSLALVLTLVLSTFAMLTVSSSAEETVLVEKGSEWQVLTYDNSDTAAPEGWQNGAGEGWEAMNAPICGEAYSGGHNHGDMTHTIVTSCHKTYMRKTFTVEDASAFSSLLLSVIYDEDPIVYINGEQVFTATGYHDGGYVDTALATSVLKDGENTICVEFKNAPSGGGSMMDLALIGNDAAVNDDGSVIIASAESYGADGNPATNPFGDIGSVNNLYDGNDTSVWGWGEKNIFTVARFLTKVKVTELYLETKDEGAMAGSTDPHGEYTVSYLDDNGEWVEIGKVDALIDGKTVAIENVETSAIKVQITEWYNDNWVSIAELGIKGEEIEEAPAPEEPTVGTLTIAPKYDSIGNWRNYTWFIVGYSCDAEANVDINNKLKDGTYTLKVVITDETGKTYTISKYAFDHVDEDWGAVGATHWGHDGSYLRICASDYGIAPSADHTYTVTFEIYEGETLKHAGTSADGAFGVNPDNGNSVAWQESGAIVLDNPPYLYDEAQQPVDPPVGPIDPPQAGDATAIIAVLAIVALFGAAVVTKKAFVK